MANSPTCNAQCVYYGNDSLNSSQIDLTAIVAGQDVISSIYICIGVIGTLLNGLVVYILVNKKILRSRILRHLMINLAVADLCSALAVILLGTKTFYIINFSSSTRMNQEVNLSLFGQELNGICKSSYIIFFMTNFVSTLNLTIIAIDRYRTFVVNNMVSIRSKQVSLGKIRLLIACFWVVSIGFAFPFIETFELTPRVNNRCLFAHSYKHCTYNIVLMAIVLSLFCVLPAVIMIFCYFNIILFLRKHATGTKNLLNNNKENQARDLNHTKLFVVITFAFTITVTPFMGYLIYVSWTNCNADEILQYLLTKSAYGWIAFHEVAHFLFILPPIINPLCYTFSSRSYRKAILNGCQCNKATAIGPSTQTNSTSNR
ncbi:uncharacterized protein TRIADDRAFT_62237 [Trichoplax adhaerens]|uniref:G-protein coupled receptors family 1 profile domain-containing protein n=1 Tax=Trichoplax adhaerens TaxID=10228 RepID=B3SD80_TRIAD|nr:hypothetical protein TRIADDRAFT_62237 [Trichoplax adhaerens]EDV19333.1 hypothetical protein TRIADDRAFT_62237 [Trichoplax adhaerens]|eukprot:XP_002118184.1 hypothetical protein TRIADDRAFT_62237 [Trichoplax adhaerens]